MVLEQQRFEQGARNTLPEYRSISRAYFNAESRI